MFFVIWICFEIRVSSFEFVFLFILGQLIGAGSRTRTGTDLAALGILSLVLPFPIGTYHTTIPLMRGLPASVGVGMCHWIGMVRAHDGHSLGTVVENTRNFKGLQNPTGLLIT